MSEVRARTDYWNGKEPTVTFVVGDWPWDRYGISVMELMLNHRKMFLTSCATALVKEGPKAITLYAQRPD